MKEVLLGYDVDVEPPGSVADEIFESINGEAESRADACRWLACLNPHSYVLARTDAEFARALRDADWLIPDGVGVVMASRILGGSAQERVTGSDVFQDVLDRMDRAGCLSVFFLGSTQETLTMLVERVQQMYPRVRVAGAFAPPFRAEFVEREVEDMITAVNQSGAEVLWVGMSAPKQEKWLYANRDRLNVRFAAAVGAVFDFYTGRVRRAGPVLQRLGLEWLPRLVQQPRRLWRRMLISAPIFVVDVVLARMRGNSQPNQNE